MIRLAEAEAEAAAGAAGFAHETLRQLVEIDGTGGVLRTIVDLFGRDVPSDLGDLRDAVGRLDADRVRRVAHSMKGAARTMGAVALGEQCLRIEMDAREQKLPTSDDMASLETATASAIDYLRRFAIESPTAST